MLNSLSIRLLLAFILVGVVVSLLFNMLAARFDPALAAIILLLAISVLFVILRHAKQRTGHYRDWRKSFTWWHWLWLCLFLSGIVIRVRDVHDIEQTVVDPWAAFRIVLIGIAALVLLVRLALRKEFWLASIFRGLLGAITVYGLFSVISSLWSVYPAWTAYKSCEYLVDICVLAVILCVLHRAPEYRGLLNWTYTLYGLLLTSVWLGVLVWPSLALVHISGILPLRLYGVLPPVDANTLGDYSAVLAIVSLVRIFLKSPHHSGNRAWYWLLFAGSFTTLILSQTRSALAALAVALLLVLWVSGRKPAAIGLIATGLFLKLTSAAPILWAYVRRGQNDALWGSLSGRMDFWGLGWEKFLERPFTGFGAYAAGRFAVLAPLGASTTSTVHNSYVEILVGVGILGLIPVLVALLGTWWILFRANRSMPLDIAEHQLAIEMLGVLAILTARSFLSTNLIWHPPLFFLLVLGYAEFLRRRHSSATSPAFEGGLQPAD
ncbi:MAG: O-antigen ligase family protein [Candidatus Acidiferrales bacterium]